MNDPQQVLNLSDAQRTALVQTKATCPFIGSAIAQQLLPVRNEIANPLASIEDLTQLGNRGGGDLGNLLAFFARGNHTQFRDQNGQLLPVPAGLFSLDLPSSQGSHPGDSGILQSGVRHGVAPKFDSANFARLQTHAPSGRLTRTATGAFIAENIRADPTARTLGPDAIVHMSHDLFELFEAAVPAALRHLLPASSETQAPPSVLQRLTKLMAEDNLVGSAGEFGLLFALLSKRDISPDGEPSLLMDDLQLMFEQKRLPPGWDSIKTGWLDWARHTFSISFAAYRAFAFPPH